MVTARGGLSPDDKTCLHVKSVVRARARNKMSIGRKVVSWARSPAPDRTAGLEAVFALSLAKLLVTSMPFRFYLPMLKDTGPHGVASSAKMREVRRAIGRASRALPWPSVCLDQAIAAKLMIARRGGGATLHLGVRKGEHGLEAHAWLECAGQTVIGAAGRAGMTDLAQFGAAVDLSAPPASPRGSPPPTSTWAQAPSRP